ncbi:MAG: hypothetical protein IT302_08555 [Dehalococcoidia bacterium]|nr:hypothetical protein [Dehalococcoidia bacterium]
MTEPIARLIPHGEAGHFETHLCPKCRMMLGELERFERQVLQLCELGYAEVAGVDYRGDRCYQLTPEGIRWLERVKARRGGRW